MKTKTEFSTEMYKELSARAKGLFIAMTVLGAVGVALYFALTFTLFKNAPYFYIVPGGIFLVAGIMLLVTVKKNEKKQGNVLISTEIELFDDNFTQIAFRNGEKIEEAKLYYKDMVQWKESKNYFFLYPNKATAYPIDKNGLGEDGCAFLRNVLVTNRIKKFML